MPVDLEKIKSLCKRRGFIFPSSEVYGGLESTWDYGPLGVELKNNVKRAWWKAVVYERDDMEGLDAAILMNRLVWKYSGHEETFSDPLVDCRECKSRFRADNLIKNQGGEVKMKDIGPWFEAANHAGAQFTSEFQARLSYIQTKEEGTGHVYNDQMQLFSAAMQNPQYNPILAEVMAMAWQQTFNELNARGLLSCPKCSATKSFTPPRRFNLMFKTFMGPVEEDSALAYLRPETAQGIFVNYLNVQTTMRRKLPFGIAQIGKAFRNEITPGNFTFRTREFEQMEIEYFVMPGTDEEWFERWVDERFNWYTHLGIKPEHLRKREQGKEELAHYAKRTIDIEYFFSIGWSEIEGIANRTDFDLRSHSKSSPENEHSVTDLTYFDQEKNEHIIPYVIEPSAGADRTTLAFLADAYEEEPVRNEKRVVLKLHKDLAPIKVAVLPLLRNRPEIVEMARKIKKDLQPAMRAVYDDTGSIGRLYRRQDEIGTPYCVTVDVQSLEDQEITVRDRDTMEQIRISAGQLKGYLVERFSGNGK